MRALLFSILTFPFRYVSHKYEIKKRKEIAKKMREVESLNIIDEEPESTNIFAKVVLEQNKELIHQTKRAFGFCHDWEREGFTFQNLFVDVIKNYCRYCANLPASEGYHHSKEFGLIDHSLQVANLALRQAKNQFLPSAYPVDIERRRTKRYQYAAWLCGLLHDAGKAQTDMVIYNKKNPEQVWVPISSDVVDWIEEYEINSYGIRWKRNRINKAHEVAPLHFFQQVLTKEAKAYIGRCPGDLVEDITIALSHYKDGTGYLQEAVRAADFISTAKDIQTTWDSELGPRKSAYYEKIIKLMQHKAREWISQRKAVAIGDEIYLRWPDCFDELAKQLHKDDPTSSGKPEILKDRLIERGILRKVENSDYAMFFSGDTSFEDAYTRLINNRNDNGIGVIRLEWPLILTKFTPIPANEVGLLKLDRNGNSVLFGSYSVDFISAEQIELERARRNLSQKSEAGNTSEKGNTGVASPKDKLGNTANTTKVDNGKAAVPETPNDEQPENAEVTRKKKSSKGSDDDVKPKSNSASGKKASKGESSEGNSKAKSKIQKSKPINTNGDLFKPKHQNYIADKETLVEAKQKHSDSTKSSKTDKLREKLKTAKRIKIDGVDYYVVDDTWSSTFTELCEEKLQDTNIIKLNNPNIPTTRYFVKQGKRLVKALEATGETGSTKDDACIKDINTTSAMTEIKNNDKNNSAQSNAEHSVNEIDTINAVVNEPKKVTREEVSNKLRLNGIEQGDIDILLSYIDLGKIEQKQNITALTFDKKQFFNAFSKIKNKEQFSKLTNANGELITLELK